MKKSTIICIIILSAHLLFLVLNKQQVRADKQSDDLPIVRMGYFQGGRVDMIYRAYIGKNFEKEGVDVHLYTTALRGTELIKLPKSHEEYLKLSKDIFIIGKICNIIFFYDIYVLLFKTHTF